MTATTGQSASPTTPRTAKASLRLSPPHPPDDEEKYAYIDRNLLNGRSHLRAKSLAGVMTTAKGKTLLFCIFVNDVLLPAHTGPSREGHVIGTLAEVIQQNAP